jgi:hypothetical protein
VQTPIAFSEHSRTVLLTLHNRLDARLLDQMAQPHQHGEAKYRDCADPSRLQGSMYVRQARLRRAVAHQLCERLTYGDMPWHVMLVREGGCVGTLSPMCDHNKRP